MTLIGPSNFLKTFLFSPPHPPLLHPLQLRNTTTKPVAFNNVLRHYPLPIVPSAAHIFCRPWNQFICYRFIGGLFPFIGLPVPLMPHSTVFSVSAPMTQPPLGAPPPSTIKQCPSVKDYLKLPSFARPRLLTLDFSPHPFDSS